MVDKQEAKEKEEAVSWGQWGIFGNSSSRSQEFVKPLDTQLIRNKEEFEKCDEKYYEFEKCIWGIWFAQVTMWQLVTL